MVWQPAPPETEDPPVEDPTYEDLVDQIVDIVNDFAPKRFLAVVVDDHDSTASGGGGGNNNNNYRNRELDHISFAGISLPEECTMLNFEHDFASVPAVLKDWIQCTDYCGPGQYVNVSITTICTTLDEEGCENTVDCIVAGCNEDCDAEAGECDCSDKFGQAEDGSLIVTGLCEEVCAAEPVDVVTPAPTLSPTLSPTSAPVTVPVPGTSSPTSAPVSATAAPTTAPVSVPAAPTTAPVPGRQKVTFEECLFTSNSITSASDDDLQGLIVAGTAFNDVVIKDCEFSDMSYGTSTTAVSKKGWI